LSQEVASRQKERNKEVKQRLVQGSTTPKWGGFALAPLTPKQSQWRNCMIVIDEDLDVSFTVQECDLGMLFSRIDSTNFKPSDEEINRCFFIALGVSMGVHPWALQTLFRTRSQAVRDAIESGDLFPDVPANVLIRQHYESWLDDALHLNSCCDMNMLLFCWPEEFRDFRILFVDKRAGSGIINRVFVYEEDAQQKKHASRKKEIVIGWNGDHFTCLKLRRTQPISKIVELFTNAGGLVGGGTVNQLDPSGSDYLFQFLHIHLESNPVTSLPARCPGFSSI
jgi:hypothetical protein